MLTQRVMLRTACLFLPTLGLAGGNSAFGDRIEGPAFDLFETPSGAFVDLSDVGLGLVDLAGVAFGPGTTDTIVERQQGIDPFNPPGGVGTIDIEVIALHLKSVAPVELEPGVFADLHVTINKTSKRGETIPGLPQPDALDPSLGRMEVRHEAADGGTFDSCFGEDTDGGSCGELGVAGGGVFADAIFPVPGGDPGDSGDVLFSMPAPRVVLSSTDSTWSHTPPPGDVHNETFCAGRFYVGTMNHDPPNPHPVEPSDILVIVTAEGPGEAKAGDKIVIDFMVTADPEILLRGYVATPPCALAPQGGATGTIDGADADLNDARPDWAMCGAPCSCVCDGVALNDPGDCPARDPRIGWAGEVGSIAAVGGVPAYLAHVSYTVSSDATGCFDFDFVDPKTEPDQKAAGSVLRDPDTEPILANWIGTTVCIVECTGADQCDDGVDCTNDACVDGSCESTANDSKCDDGVSCTNDSCDPVNDCQNVADDAKCDDGVDCTNDSCDSVNDCQNVANDDKCDDGADCTNDTCDPAAGGCVFTSNDDKCPGCQDCANGVCVDNQSNCSGCQDCVNGVCVDNQAKCFGCEACQDGVCVDNQGKCFGCEDCQDGVCVDEQEKCFGCEDCVDGACVPNSAKCDDGSVCTEDTCEPSSGSPDGCVFTDIIGATACCLDDKACENLEPACCDERGGTAVGGGTVLCKGDSDGDGTDDLCELFNVPSLSEWGLLVISLLLVTGLAFKFGRRRQKTAA